MTVHATTAVRLPVTELAGSPYREELVRLHNADPAATPFQHPELLVVWWETVGRYEPGLEGHVVLGKDSGGAVRWYMPLATETTAASGAIRYLGDPYSDYHVLVTDPALTRQEAGAAFRGHLREGGHGPVHLNEWRHETDDYRAAGWQVRPATECPHLDLTDATLLRRVRDKREYAMKARRLDRAGRVDLEVLTGREAAGAPMDGFVAMHRAQWDGVEGAVGGFDDPAVERFFHGLTNRTALDDHVRLFVLTLDGMAFAYYFCFVKYTVCHGYRTTYDPKLRKVSPGAVLLRAMVNRLASDGYEEFDFMRGAYAYKQRFAGGVRRNQALHLPPAGGMHKEGTL